MMLNAYAIYDRKSLIFHSPFFAVADGAAVRSFADLANETTNNIGRHPSDFVLYKVGMWDDNKGAFLPEVPLHLTDALPLVKPPLQHDFFATMPKTGPQDLPKASNGEDR